METRQTHTNASCHGNKTNKHSKIWWRPGLNLGRWVTPIPWLRRQWTGVYEIEPCHLVLIHHRIEPDFPLQVLSHSFQLAATQILKTESLDTRYYNPHSLPLLHSSSPIPPPPPPHPPPPLICMITAWLHIQIGSFKYETLSVDQWMHVCGRWETTCGSLPPTLIIPRHSCGSSCDREAYFGWDVPDPHSLIV